MGNHESSQSRLDLYYGNLIGRSFYIQGNKTGGNEFAGGYSDLEGYVNSVHSQGKEKLIRDIAGAISRTLKITNTFADTAPINEVITKLKRAIPDPKAGRNIIADSKIQQGICNDLASAINKLTKVKMIDEEAPAHEKCKKVSEFMLTLLTGLQNEFLSISGDVSRIIKNLQTLKEMTDSINKKLMVEIEDQGDGTTSGEIQNRQKIYDKVSAEINRQLAMLDNMVGTVIGPVTQSLVKILEENKDFVGLVDDIKNTVGSTYFGDQLAQLLTGMYDVARAAEMTEKALRQLGMSVADYKNTSSLQEVRDKTYNAIMKHAPFSSSQEFQKLIRAADIVARNDLSHDDIVAHLNSKKGGFDIGEVSYASMVDDTTWRDPTNTPFQGRTQSYRRSVEKQIREQKKFRDMIFHDFNSKLRKHNEGIAYAVGIIAKKIGNEIPSTPQLEQFIKLIRGFADTQPNRKNIHLALSGYRTDALSSYTKFRYLDYAKNLIEECNTHSKGKGGEYFRELGTQIKNLVNSVDTFTRSFTETLSKVVIDISTAPKRGGIDEVSTGGEMDDYEVVGGKKKKHKEHKETEVHRPDNLVVDNTEEEYEIKTPEESIVEETPVEETKEETSVEENKEETPVEENKEEEEVPSMGGVVGGDFESALGGIAENRPDEDFTHFISLRKALRMLEHYYKLSNLKGLLKGVAVENVENAKNIESLVGEEAAYQIDEIQKRYNLLIESANGIANTNRNEKELYTQKLPTAGGMTALRFNDLKTDATNALASQLEGYKFLLEYIRQANIEMLEAAQAIELYLSKFTQKIESNPDTIRTFAQITEQLEMVSKWFVDKSGDNYAAVFEAFENKDRDLSANIIVDSNTAIAHNTNVHNALNGTYEIKDHYYTSTGIATGFPGMFYAPRLMTREQAVEFVKTIEKSIKSVRALENLVNLFTKVNSGGSDNIKTFMSPGLIFKAFMKYCVASVISIGYRIINTNTGAANNTEFYPATNPTIDFKYNVNDIKNNAAAASFVRMAVGLRTSQEFIPIRRNAGNAYFLQLLNPLAVHTGTEHKVHVPDKVFQMCIKSIIAKIFTVIGTYTIFNRPPKDIEDWGVKPNNAIRQILGGSPTSTKIYVEASELYLRLTLLAEWYRTVFEFEPNNGFTDDANFTHQGAKPIVTIIPEMDNIWGDFCKVIFIDGRSIKDGTYPAEYAKKIIESIGNIYTFFASKKKDITCKEIIAEFILEINRRFGFVYREEINKYYDEREKNLRVEEYGEENFVEYDILDSENQFGRTVAPSDRFRTQAARAASRRTVQIEDFNVAVKRFLYSVEENLILDQGAFTPDDHRVASDVSLDNIVRLTQDRLKKASTDEDRYRIIYEQIQGVEKFGDVDQNKLLAFHETVITPLTILYFTYLIINDYNKLMVSMNLESFEKAVNDLVDTKMESRGYGRLMGLAADTGLATQLGNNNVGNNAEGFQGLLLAIRIIEENNKKFKGKGNIFKLDDNDLSDRKNGRRDAICTTDEIKKYFLQVNGAAQSTLVLAGYMANAADIKTNDFKTLTGDNRKAVIRRFILDRTLLMEDVLRMIMNTSCELNGLVDYSFSGEGNNRYPVVNFDRLETVAMGLFQSAKDSLSKLRKYLPFARIDTVENSRYTNANGVQSPNVISMFWIQENLFDRLFKNKYGNGLIDANIGLKNIWLELTREHKFNCLDTNNVPVMLGADCKTTTRLDGTAGTVFAQPTRIAPVATGPETPGTIKGTPNGTNTVDLLNEYKYDSYNNVLSKLVFWDVSDSSNLVADALGFRNIQSQGELNEFPAYYAPIYKTGGSYGNPTTRAQKDILNAKLIVTGPNTWGSNNEDTAALHNFDEKVLQGFFRGGNAGVDINYYWMLGTTNLYDYSIGKDSFSDLKGKDNGDPSTGDLGGIDRIAPGLADVKSATATTPVNTLHNKLGLLPKLNNIVYRYVKTFIDNSTKKIYRPLLEKFAHGYNAKDIFQSKNINDRVICGFEYQDIKALASQQNTPLGMDVTRPAAQRSNVQRPDKLQDLIPAICHMEPPEQAVLFASLASAIKGIFIASSERVTGNVSRFLEDNLANITEFQKELMRAYLPVFIKELDMLIKRASFLKEIIENSRCKVYKWNQSCLDIVQPAAGGAGLFNNLGKVMDERGVGGFTRMVFNNINENSTTYTQPLRMPVVEHESARKTYLINMLVDIISTAKSLRNVAHLGSKELSDIPLYFETSKDSISDYNSRNGHLPLMPLSNLTHLMNFNLHRVSTTNGTHQYENKIYIDTITAASDYTRINANDPTAENNTQYILHIISSGNDGIGSPSFKFAYGTRGILSPDLKPSAEFAPGVTSLLDLVKTGGASYDKVYTNNFVQDSILLARYVLDYNYLANILDMHNFHRNRELLHGGIPRDDPLPRNNFACQVAINQRYQGTDVNEFWKRTENITLMSENDNFRQAMYRFIASLTGTGNRLYSNNRIQNRIFNILDLGMSPINRHALQKEIPFANLMNYSYAFDSIIKYVAGVGLKNARLKDIHGYIPLTPADANTFIPAVGEFTYSDGDFKKLYYPEDAMVHHLIFPMGFRRFREYVNFTYRLYAGDASYGLNRPKFLSDQLWNKVLLNSIYDRNYAASNSILPNSDRFNLSNIRRNESRREAEMKSVIFGFTDEKDIVDKFLEVFVNNTPFITKCATEVLAGEAAVGQVFSADIWARNNPSREAAELSGINIASGQLAIHDRLVNEPSLRIEFVKNIFRTPTIRAHLQAVVTHYLTNRSLNTNYILIYVITDFLITLHNYIHQYPLNFTEFNGDLMRSLNNGGISQGASPGAGPGNRGSLYITNPPPANYYPLPVGSIAFVFSDFIEHSMVFQKALVPNFTNKDILPELQSNINQSNFINDDSNEILYHGISIISTVAANNNRTPYISRLTYENKAHQIVDAPDSLQINRTKNLFALEGYMRYNTNLIRYTEWFANLQRITRVFLRRQLEWVKDPLVSANNALSEEVTEYTDNNEGFRIDEFE